MKRMNPTLRKNLPVILAFALPLGLIVVITLSALLPSWSIKTEYNFVYAACDETSYVYDCTRYLPHVYKVEEGNLNIFEVTIDEDELPRRDVLPATIQSRLYLHNTKTNESREISAEEAQNLTYTTLKTSPDGYTLTQGDNGRVEVFPFYSSSNYDNWYLSKGGAKKRMHVITNNYYRNFYFVGWVTNSTN